MNNENKHVLYNLNMHLLRNCYIINNYHRNKENDYINLIQIDINNALHVIDNHDFNII